MDMIVDKIAWLIHSDPKDIHIFQLNKFFSFLMIFQLTIWA